MSTADLVHQAVLADLLDGRLTPGTWVRQDELADQLGVSKIPVREALQRLTTVGLLRLEPNRGAVVPHLNADAAAENYALRLAIEPLLLQRAVGQLTATDLGRATDALAAADRRTAAANWRFHRALYQPSGWRRGVDICATLHAAVAPYVALYIDDLGGSDRSQGEHRQLLAACRRGNTDRANALLVAHLSAARDTLLSHLTSR